MEVQHEVMAVTGHRPSGIDNDYTYSSEIWRGLKKAYEELFIGMNVDHLLTGGALGVDTVAAEVALSSGIPYTVCVPFDGQDSKWPKKAKQRYERLLDNSEGIIVVSPGPYAVWKLHRRNEFMVDNSSMVLATWNGKPKGGTYECVQYAVKKKSSVLRLDPFSLEYGWYNDEGWENLGKIV
jgi:uncharacterized phage-like protein YoqJ